IAMFEVAHESRLIDRVERTDAHRNRRELPEIRHQPRMWIGRKRGLASGFMAEIQHLLLGDASFEKSASICARRCVPLEIDHVAGLVAVAGMKEVIETDFGQSC